MFLAGCTMNTGSKKLQREVGSTFCGAQAVITRIESNNRRSCAVLRMNSRR